ncbi:putative ATPase [Methylophaga frappieri]|uniref:Putative ATPase n=1 Tax=Methylophaga frappieri (strain ATCC BAA-2434 / DSM 25690 / JAM7) TaxID=754477 RepID=I1YH35_METFJ|nr:YcjX family protein [Methylophaga frappieri]AFJ02228.1 putative ATPase [Methylophaga frappieri]
MTKTADSVRNQFKSQWQKWQHRGENLLGRSFDRHLKIGVTGFSGSGKSTFLTSLIHQLKYSHHPGLGGFLPARDKQLLSVDSTAIPGFALFDYAGGIAALSDTPPRWPNPTSEVSATRLHITFKKGSVWSGLLGDARQLTLDLRDYPGEWLMDMPMLKLSYRDWCLDQQQLLSRAPRADLDPTLLADLHKLDPMQTADTDFLTSLFQRWQTYLRQAKQAGLTLLQPGRALLDTDDNLPMVLPLLSLHDYSPEQLEKANETTLYQQLRQQYHQYLDNLVKPFYRQFFTGIDRQVMLIDVVKALSHGEECFNDMMMAYSRIIDCYQMGNQIWLKQLFTPTVNKILFLASKPDRLLMHQHEALRQLVDAMIKRICPQSVRHRIRIETEIAAAVRSSIDHQDYLTATLQDGRFGELRHPPIPDELPQLSHWQQLAGWTPPVLRPPVNPQLAQGGRLAHIRMDKVLRDLIGDKFS